MASQIEIKIVGTNLPSGAFKPSTEQLDEMRKFVENSTGGLVTFNKEGGATRQILASVGEVLGPNAQGFLSMAAGVASGTIAFSALSQAGQMALGVIKESLSQAAEAELNQKKLTTALVSQGLAVPEVVRQYDDLAKSLNETTTNSQSQLVAMEALLVQVGDVTPSKMKGALMAATDLAAGLGIDLREATLLVAKASDENVAALKKAGVTLDETRVKAEGMPYVLDQINRRFGGQAAAEVDTYAGKIKNLGKTIDDAKEALGQTLISVGAGDVIKGITTEIERRILEFKIQIEAAKTLAAAVAGATAHPLDPLGGARRGMAGVAPQPSYGPTLSAKDAEALHDQQKKEQADKTKRLQDEADQREKDKKSREAYIQSVKDEADVLTGTKLAQETIRLADAVREAGGVANLTSFQYQALGKQLTEMRQQGALLPPVLAEIANGYQQFQRAAMPRVMPGDIANIQSIHDQWKAMLDDEHKAEMEAQGLKNVPGLPPAFIEQIERGAQAWDQMGDAAKKMGYDTRGSLLVASQAFSEFEHWAKTSGRFGPEELAEIHEEATRRIKAAHAGTTHFIEINWEQTFANIAQSGIRALEGGGNVFKSIGATAGSEFGDIAGNALKKAIGGQAGKFLGGLLGPLGSLAGGLLGGVIDKLFNHSHGRDLVSQFADSQGGYDQLHKQLLSLGADGEQLWIKLTQGVGKNNAAQAKATIDQVTAALQRMKDVGDTLTATTSIVGELTSAMQRYGLTEDQLGNQFKQLKENQGIAQLFEDIQLFTDNKADFRTLLTNADGTASGLLQQIQAMVDAAEQNHLAIYDEFKPILQQLSDAGQLRDLGGNVATLDALGLRFQSTPQDIVAAEAKKSNDWLEKIYKALTGNYKTAAAGGGGDSGDSGGAGGFWRGGGDPAEFLTHAVLQTLRLNRGGSQTAMRQLLGVA